MCTVLASCVYMYYCKNNSTLLYIYYKEILFKDSHTHFATMQLATKSCISL